MSLSEAEHARISDAIASAERSTSGEIFCVIARKSDDYHAVPFAWAALTAIVLPPVLLWFGIAGFDRLNGGWNAVPYGVREIVSLYAGISVLIFILAFVIVRVPAIKLRLTPPSLRRAAVHRSAVESFLSHGIHVTNDRIGVLIFLSLADHVAEIVADETIYGKVDAGVWGDAIAALLAAVRAGRTAEGFVDAIAMCGSVLAAHFPPRTRNPNELPDRLIEI
jgi:putative membrane protein